MSPILLLFAFQNEVVEVDVPDQQPTNDPQQSGAQAYASLNEATRSPAVTDPPRQAQVSVYESLDLKTRSWEVPRESLTIEKIIGKGAFGQVAKATATDLHGAPGKTIVAIKMLKGKWNFSSEQRGLAVYFISFFAMHIMLRGIEIIP